MAKFPVARFSFDRHRRGRHRPPARPHQHDARGSGNTSQKLMRLRVVLQFVAIVIIMFTIWVMAK